MQRTGSYVRGSRRIRTYRVGVFGFMPHLPPTLDHHGQRPVQSIRRPERPVHRRFPCARGWIGHEMRRLLAAWAPQAEMSRGMHLPYRLAHTNTPRISVPRWRARGQPIDARGARAKHGVKPLPLRPESSHTQETQPPFNTSATCLILPERPTPQSNCGPTPNERNGIGQETHHSGHAHPCPATWAGSWNWNVLPIRWRYVLLLRRKPVCGMRA